VFHVFNRAIEGHVLFEQDGDYLLWLSVVRQAADRFGMRILAYAAMPNQWHLVLWPPNDTALSLFMHWLTTTHARRWRGARGSTGRGAIYQGRFKAVAVQQNAHFLRACRYVERNPLRARLVGRVEDWEWGSASPRARDEGRPPLAEWPVARPATWLDLLNLPEPRRELAEIRDVIRRGLPFGNAAWQASAVRRLRWRRGCRPPGRPKGRQAHARQYCN
jgi:putative transposase